MNIRKLALLPLAATLSLPGIASAAEAGWSGNVNGFLGGKRLVEDDFDADRHVEFGIMFDITPPSWPVSLAVDSLGSYGEETDSYYDSFYGWSDTTQEISTSELDLGVRKIWQAGGTMRPYLGGGLSLFSLSVKQVTEPDAYNITITEYDEDGTGAGLWLDTGIFWTLSHFNIGFDLRFSRGQVELDGTDYQAGGNHLGVMAGYHW